MSKELQISRRDFLETAKDVGIRTAKSALAIKLASFLTACGETSGQENPPLVQKEFEHTPRASDIIVVRDEAFLLRNGRVYPVLERFPTIGVYLDGTRFHQFGRQLFDSMGTSIEGYEMGEINASPQIKDPYTGNMKNNQLEIPTFFPGLMTDGGVPYNYIENEADTFLYIRGGLDLTGADCLFFTYGERGKSSYPIENTARDPEENSKYALEYFETIKELFPLAQFNVIAHSLGGIFALAAAMEHYDAINNLIFINSPVRGFKKDFATLARAQMLKQTLRALFGIEEKVTDYLFGRWENKDYQRKLREFVLFFKSIGRKIIIIIDENDLIVPEESAIIEGAEIVRLTKENYALLPFTPSVVEGGLAAHGRPLRDKNIIKQIGEMIARPSTRLQRREMLVFLAQYFGKNLAAAI